MYLQIDVVSLYLIYLVQMTTSGLQIIYTKDEVAFVQNLVYYIERAYRTPDYAMWERGSSYNDNTPEIHARLVPMLFHRFFMAFEPYCICWDLLYVLKEPLRNVNLFIRAFIKGQSIRRSQTTGKMSVGTEVVPAVDGRLLYY